MSEKVSENLMSEGGPGPREAVSPPTARGRWTWGRLLLVAFLLFCAGLALTVQILVRTSDAVLFLDFAVANLVTMLLGFLASIVFLTWFTLFAPYRFLVRVLPLTAIVLGIAGFFSQYRLADFSGAMVPRFVRRDALPPDRLLDTTQFTAVDSPVDMTTQTALDFPQFLGPERTGVITGRRLNPDWAANPPKLLWRQKIGAGWAAFAAVNGFAVTLEQRGDDEWVTCYDVETGKLCWSHAVPGRHQTYEGGTGPRSTPTIYQGRVYAMGATGVLRCLDGATGELIWDHNIFEQLGTTVEADRALVAWGRANSPLAVDGQIILPYGGKEGGPFVSLAAFSAENGDILWKCEHQQISYASPSLATLAGTRQILSVNEKSVSGHDPENGELLWSHEWPGVSNANANCSQAVLVAENQILLSKGYAQGAVLIEIQEDGKTQELWHNATVLKTKFSNVCVKDGYAYGLSDSILECVEVSTGQRMWKRGRYGFGQVLLVDDLLLVQAEDGRVVMVRATPERHQELGEFQAIEGKTWNNLALYGDRLLVRNGVEAACYQLPTEETPSAEEPNTTE